MATFAPIRIWIAVLEDQKCLLAVVSYLTIEEENRLTNRTASSMDILPVSHGSNNVDLDDGRFDHLRYDDVSFDV